MSIAYVVPHAHLRTLNRGARGQLMNLKDITIMLHISDDDVAQKILLAQEKERMMRIAKIISAMRAVWTHKTMN